MDTGQLKESKERQKSEQFRSLGCGIGQSPKGAAVKMNQTFLVFMSF